MSDDIPHQLRERGWCDPRNVLSAADAALLARSYRQYSPALSNPNSWRGTRTEPDFAARPWFKSLHAISPEFFDLAVHETILREVRSVLGPDIIVWGVSCAIRSPGQIHRWHTDVEHLTWEGVTAFIGLKDVVPQRSGLKFIGRSHRLQARIDKDVCTSDETTLQYARQFDPGCTLDYPAMGTGDCILFSGRMWHGSHNTAELPRAAALIQYSRPDARICIPLTWDEPVVWAGYRPPCILVSGRNTAGNNCLARPAILPA